MLPRDRRRPVVTQNFIGCVVCGSGRAAHRKGGPRADHPFTVTYIGYWARVRQEYDAALERANPDLPRPPLFGLAAFVCALWWARR